MSNTNIEVKFNHANQAPLPKDFFSLECTDNFCSQYMYIFGRCSFRRAAAGHYYIQVVKRNLVFNEIKREYENNIIASSKLMKVKINNTVEYADLYLIFEDPDPKYSAFEEDININFLNKFLSDRKEKLNERRSMMDHNSDYFEVLLNKTYYIALRLFDTNYRVIANQTLMRRPIPSFVEYPPSMNAIKDKIPNYFSFVGFSNRTDKDGFYYIKFFVKYGAIGAFSFAFDFGTCNTDSVSIITNNVIKSISILQEPSFINKTFDDISQNAYYVGRIFDIKAKVKVEVYEGPLAGYIVIAQPFNLTNNYLSCDFFATSQFVLDEKKENDYGWATVLPTRYAITDKNGEAIFEDLGILDISGISAICKFYFVVGDRYPKMYLMSSLTEASYKFISSAKFEIISQPSSFISANTYISSNPKIRVTSKIKRKYWTLSMQLFEFNSNRVIETLNSDFTIKFIYNNFCFMVMTDPVITHGRCIWKNYQTISQGINQFLEVEFTGMKWSINGISTGIKMSFASSLQHNTSNAAVSRKIEVETSANSLTFITDPPDIVQVKEIFSIELQAKIKGGAPSTNSIIDCNVTKSFDLSHISYEIFTSLGNTKFNIEKSNLLSPGSKIEESMTRGTTNKNGIARIYLQIKESPLNSEVRIMCQTGSTITHFSSPVKIKHPFEKLIQAENYYETVKVTFGSNKNANVIPNIYSQEYYYVKVRSEIVLNIVQNESSNASINSDDITILLVK